VIGDRLLIDHLPSGEIVFNSYTTFAVWATQHSPGTKAVAHLIKFPGVEDPHAFERWNPRLTLVKEILLSREPEITQFPCSSACTTGCKPAAPAGPGREPSSCATASEGLRASPPKSTVRQV
jgi:hypothetical protein